MKTNVSSLAFLAAFRIAAGRLKAKGLDVGLAAYTKTTPDQHQVGVVINRSGCARVVRLNIETTTCPMPGQEIEPLAYYDAVANKIQHDLEAT